jgi:peptidyl-dipeptidase A
MSPANLEAPTLTTPTQPSMAELEKFIQEAEMRLNDVSIKMHRTSYVQQAYITEDTQAIAAGSYEAAQATVFELMIRSKQFDGMNMPPESARKIHILRHLLATPAPNNVKERIELVRLGTSLDAAYGKAAYCPSAGPFADKRLAQTEIERAMATTRDADVLLDLWKGWHDLFAPLRSSYSRYVELANKGAREMGWDDVGDLWRSNYDMLSEQLAAEVERLWNQVRPLFLSLHTYVRARLAKVYGKQLVPDDYIPAHLLGNVWAQSWTNIIDLLEIPRASGMDITATLQQKGADEIQMVRFGEHFFTSLGFEPLPKTFWQRSIFKKPADRDMVSQASAWCIDNQQDLRIRMCIGINEEDFRVIHHELGHLMYYRAYRNQPTLFKEGANDAFHEAIGDTIALSITPAYLKDIGLLAEVPEADNDIGLLLHRALEKVAFLPFSLVMDQWRWQVLSGKIRPEDYNAAWWNLRKEYQGVIAPAPRTEAHFDAAAKYHVPVNIPYLRYFLGRILQFQFHRGLCRASGWSGPLHRGSIYGHKAAGDRLQAMLEMGASKPWPDALHALCNEREMDASAMLEYFAPLKEWLDQQNARNG